MPTVRRTQESGMVLLAVLVFVLLTTFAVGSMVHIYKTATQREKEEQLLFVGHQYRSAIRSYYSITTTGGARRLPTSIEDLINDSRFPTPMHHLRQAYPDPMTGSNNWELVRQGSGIIGIHSQSGAEPFKKDLFLPEDKTFVSAASYRDWVFSVNP